MNFLHPKNIFPIFSPVYRLLHKVSLDTNLLMFQYKILNNILYLNKHLFILNQKYTKLFLYCRLQDKKTNHIFVTCKFAIKLWSDLKDFCQCSFDLPVSNPQSATFGFFGIDSDLFILLNHILLLYKYYIYLSRDCLNFSFAALFKNIYKLFDLKKNIERK